MAARVKTQEEVTTIDDTIPRVVRKTVREVEPEVRGEAPQQVYEKKKTIFRFNQVVWYIAGLLEVVLAFRFILKLLGANPFSGFTNFIYSLTDIFVAPFNGILGVVVSGNATVEWSTIIAAIVYLCVAWGIVYLLDLMYPITPTDVDVQ